MAVEMLVTDHFFFDHRFGKAFLVQPVRLMTAMYACDLIINSAGLGKVRYSSVMQRWFTGGSQNCFL